MSSDVIERWYKSNQPAQLNGYRVRLADHPALAGAPIVIRRCQAEAHPVRADDGTTLILKKFLPGKEPDARHLQTVGGVLPNHESFRSGTDRRILSGADLSHAPGCYFSSKLQRWLDGTVLMPRVQGCDWAGVADDIRNGSLSLGRDDRLILCLNLAVLVQYLVAHQCAHRDLSAGNVFLNVGVWTVHLIDFDSLYHPRLSMPPGTTCGTEGYMAPFVWKHGAPDAAVTWHPRADFYALTILCVEFLTLDPGAPIGHEGGLFDQEQLTNRRGSALDWAASRLQAEYLGALPLFEAAIASRRYEDCPTPEDWIRFCNEALAVDAPNLDDWENPTAEDFKLVPKDFSGAPPVWPAPRLDDFPEGLRVLPGGPVLPVPLPVDPWTV